MEPNIMFAVVASNAEATTQTNGLLMQAEQRRMLVEMVQEGNKQCSQYLQSSPCKLFPFRFCKYRTISNHNYSYIL